jgi:2-hydroxychromene-2-carboxylate isomerase
MSGGSWDYLYERMEDAAGRLLSSDDNDRRAFGRLMRKCAKAMHDIEWVDSCDYGEGDELVAIRAALGANAPSLAIHEAVTRAEEVMDKLSESIVIAKRVLDTNKGGVK